jgi:hypothetical protein
MTAPSRGYVSSPGGPESPPSTGPVELVRSRWRPGSVREDQLAACMCDRCPRQRAQENGVEEMTAKSKTVVHERLSGIVDALAVATLGP